MHYLFGVAAATAGGYLVYISTEVETFGAMQKGPGLAIIWIYLIMQMNLLPSLLSLLPVIGFYARKELSLWLGANLKDLHPDL